jgi:uncharacterized membrane protein (UPF0127 family)
MRIWIAVLMLSFSSLLLGVGCGGEKSSAPSESTEETTPSTAASATVSESEASRTPTVIITNSEGERVAVEVEIADNDAERQRGLMERTALAENAGMLFVFEREKPLAFWMKNTLIPLSVAYIDSNGRIVDIQDMEPLDETTHPSAEPARYALEVNQGFFAERGIEVGNEMEIPDLSGSSG